jgi:hypothetical protein
LGEKISYNAGLIIMASWVVRRPPLKWYLWAPINEWHRNKHVYKYMRVHDGTVNWQVTVKWNKKWCCRRNLDNMILEERMIECRLFGDVHTVYDISIWALWISENQYLQQDMVIDSNTTSLAVSIIGGPLVFICCIDFTLVQKGPTILVGNPFSPGFLTRTANPGLKAPSLITRILSLRPNPTRSVLCLFLLWSCSLQHLL